MDGTLKSLHFLTGIRNPRWPSPNELVFKNESLWENENKSFFLEATNMIETKLYMNGPMQSWHFFYVCRFEIQEVLTLALYEMKKSYKTY